MVYFRVFVLYVWFHSSSFLLVSFLLCSGNPNLHTYANVSDLQKAHHVVERPYRTKFVFIVDERWIYSALLVCVHIDFFTNVSSQSGMSPLFITWIQSSSPRRSNPPIFWLLRARNGGVHRWTWGSLPVMSSMTASSGFWWKQTTQVGKPRPRFFRFFASTSSTNGETTEGDPIPQTTQVFVVREQSEEYAIVLVLFGPLARARSVCVVVRAFLIVSQKLC